MQRFTTSRQTLASLLTLALLITAAFSPVLLLQNVQAANPNVTINNSYTAAPASARLLGQHASNGQVAISVVLKANNATSLNSLLNNLYTPSSSQYHHWLAQGQFNARFAPTTAQIAAVSTFLKQGGLTIDTTPSPFLVRAHGTSAQVSAVFHTRINDYAAANGQHFYQNDSNVSIPASLSGIIENVAGLSSTASLHPNYVTTQSAAKHEGKKTPQYGAGPGGSGLTPSQTSSLYNATGTYKQGNRGQGKGATLAVFELSGYTASDITTYEHQFFGSSENVPIVDINVDGGPISPVCPTGDTCVPGPDYSGDIEVEADIEQQIALAPKINRILVYNAPNDFNGTTGVNEYFKIASDDLADSISSSWGQCEQDAGIALAQAESVAFMQMAAQGQSMFSAAGDTGAYSCLRGSGNTALAVLDPASQPYVTAVGGTSFGTFDPGANQHPTYPKGAETVWNVLDLCSGTANGLGYCAEFGAGGGGVSRFWARPWYQSGPGVNSSYSQKGPYCSQASNGQYCREVPDVSANADEFTPYAEYCTGDASTNSTCATIPPQPAPGWFGIGGTSLSSPLWSAIIALYDSVHGSRFGTANCGLYQLFHSDYSSDFHDITGKNQTENNNGYYPTTPNYDLATGIGSPNISDIDK